MAGCAARWHRTCLACTSTQVMSLHRIVRLTKGESKRLWETGDSQNTPVSYQIEHGVWLQVCATISDQVRSRHIVPYTMNYMG